MQTQCMQWLKRRAGASFGFGGKLAVYFPNKKWFIVDGLSKTPHVVQGRSRAASANGCGADSGR